MPRGLVRSPEARDIESAASGAFNGTSAQLVIENDVAEDESGSGRSRAGSTGDGGLQALREAVGAVAEA